MKKLCSECGHVNDYEASVCAKCGRDLNNAEKYKQCPVCGKTYPLIKDECPDCRETLVVHGHAAAQIFDETNNPKGIGPVSWIVSMILPVLGFVYALFITSKKVKNGDMSQNERKEICMISLFAGLIVFFAVYILVSLIVGNLSF